MIVKLATRKMTAEKGTQLLNNIQDSLIRNGMTQKEKDIFFRQWVRNNCKRVKVTQK